MAKITTADCKKFLVAQITANPRIIHEIYADTVTAIHEAKIAGNWVRECKYKVRDCDGFYTHSGTPVAAEDLAWFRRFVLLPAIFDSAVVFEVLEDKKGNLILGEYCGD